MALSVLIEFDDPRKYPPLLRLSNGVQRPDIRRVMGRAIAGALRRYFTKLDRERPNQLGGTRTHFWGQVRRSVQQPELVGGDGVKVAINHVGIAQRYFGGDIEASPGKKLTIPVNPEAYGHRAREFTDLHPIWFEDGSGVLVRDHTESPGDIGEVFYRLVKRVHQDGDETVLPPEDGKDGLEAIALNAGEEHLQTLVARAA
ncbi:MAG: hypothetical protein HZA93_13260 [Verrucomicrobia bacterium]|nr:hypothetical protein [Verrucomicrobiota bacterium]